MKRPVAAERKFFVARFSGLAVTDPRDRREIARVATPLAANLERDLERGRAQRGETERLQEAPARRVMAEDAHESKIAYDARMRARFLVAVIALAGVVAAGAACRTQPFDHPVGSGFDLGGDAGAGVDGGGARDFAVVPDMARPGCHGIVDCIVACSSNQCPNQCYVNGSNKGRNLFDAAEGCGINYCLGMLGDPVRCVVDSGGNLVTPTGHPPQDCETCIQNILVGLFGGSCFPASDAACSTSQCKMEYANCLNN
jgi:hypothetical protein